MTDLKDKLKKANDIWFELHIGNIKTIHEFEIIKESLISNESRLNAIYNFNFDQYLENYRKELHRLLDKIFNNLLADFNRILNYNGETNHE